MLPPASAAVSELFVTPENPVVGDTITISGTASPDEPVNVVVSFEKTVSPSDGMYLYRMDGIEVPSGSNTFTVTARDVVDLNVRLKLSLWWTKPAVATGGIATVSHSNLEPGIYSAQIDGTPAAGTPHVTLDITAAQDINADASGNFVYSYATNSIPIGDFQLIVSGLAKTITLSPKSDESSSVGGGSSGGGASLETFENLLISETQREYVTKDSNVSYYFHLDGNVVRYINFTCLTNSSTIASKVEILDHTSTLVDSTPPDIVYKNLNIGVGNLGWANPENIASPTINFFVEKSWVTENNIDKSTIRLNRYNGGQWNRLDTEKMGEDEDNLYFDAQTPEFSSFAITGKVKQSGIVQPTSTNDLESGLMPQTIEPHETKPMQSTSKTTGFEISTGVLGLLIVIFIIRKKY
ncbi:MAG: PGF-pre-PGF domain-containing protein [ANME-2 cluster archaeon]|nr:PGF-pre-PGF domain-containing protein [ANME-2 cluster archaeon]MBC2747969.1 PGF-pre-PGF domain-containing protein [ANME-2 cluster archaeon]